jgi:predicted lipoprotein with Yx(FWY)xxD motif
VTRTAILSIAVLAVGAATLATASGSAGLPSAKAPAPSATTAPSAASASPDSEAEFRQTPDLPAGFTAQPSLVGRVLGDHQGRTLYSTASAPLRSTSVSPWQPLEMPSLAVPKAPFGKVAMPDGRFQWTYRGRALYRHQRDRDPQDIRGHGLEGGWKAVILQPAPALPPWATVQRVDVGWVFANRQGLTVYAPARPEDQAAAQTCPPECMRQYWRPLFASPEDRPVGRWTIVVDPEGRRQWAYSGRPLYTHTRDKKPGEMTGNSFAVGYRIGDGFRVIPVETQIAALDT